MENSRALLGAATVRQTRVTAQLLLLCSDRWVEKVRQGSLGPGGVQPRETKVSGPSAGGHKKGVLCYLLEDKGRTEQPEASCKRWAAGCVSVRLSPGAPETVACRPRRFLRSPTVRPGCQRRTVQGSLEGRESRAGDSKLGAQLLTSRETFLKRPAALGLHLPSHKTRIMTTWGLL